MPSTSADNSILATGRPVRIPTPNGKYGSLIYNTNFRLTTLGDRLTLTDLAGVACLSLYHFSRSFKLALGIGPQRYVMRCRLKRAKTLMRRTNQPLAWVAREAGFVDQSHLTSVFRRETGMTPGQFRAARR
jgi:transcriptional regulator GlxA family with amidase domain